MTAADVATRERAALLRFALRITGSLERAEDAVQDATLKALERPDVTGERAAPWLYTVLRHASYAQARQPTLSLELAGEPHATERDADELLDFNVALRTCKPAEARALALKAAGWSYEEIAGLTAWTRTKVNRNLAEGRARMRKACAS